MFPRSDANDHSNTTFTQQLRPDSRRCNLAFDRVHVGIGRPSASVLLSGGPYFSLAWLFTSFVLVIVVRCLVDARETYDKAYAEKDMAIARQNERVNNLDLSSVEGMSEGLGLVHGELVKRQDSYSEWINKTMTLANSFDAAAKATFAGACAVPERIEHRCEKQSWTQLSDRF